MTYTPTVPLSRLPPAVTTGLAANTWLRRGCGGTRCLILAHGVDPNPANLGDRRSTATAPAD